MVTAGNHTRESTKNVVSSFYIFVYKLHAQRFDPNLEFLWAKYILVLRHQYITSELFLLSRFIILLLRLIFFVM
jgi:hypothetical protein